ncbi:aromatic ring-hydroxylating oxygenase subunit alpha [Sphingosinithalassobacter portus]|uniref:aromatic ring-hydroxylating oxygenase subunit alpha n=1 Tax=Stakelama portus TaxID=2676234 RepID=UPI000D6E3D59|nr:SRPBCC family protein [Sphingosinithalassobacter portus]
MNDTIEAQPQERKWPAEGVSRVPAWIYSDPEIYARELEVFHYGKVWNYVGLDCEVPEPNTFRRSWIGERPVIITRDADGEIHVVENRCAHRGSLLCWQNSGKAKDLTCPYHHWSYSLKGDLMGLPFLRGVQGKGGMPRDFDKTKNSLTKLRVAVRGGSIWATYSDETPPLEDYLGEEILTRLDRLVSRRPLRLVGYSRQVVDSNWKLYWENSRDPYHATLMHPFLSTFGILRTDGDYHSVPLQEGRHEYTYSQYDPELRNRTSEASAQIKSIKTTLQIQDTDVVNSVVDEFNDGMMGAFQVFPTILVQQYFNCLVVRHIIPKGVGKHELVWTYFGYADDDEQVSELRLKQSNLVGPAGFVSLEDSEVLSLMQPVVEGSPHALQVLEMGGHGTEAQSTMMTETLIRAFYDFYRREMGL